MIGFMPTPPKPSESDCSDPATAKRYEIFDKQRPWTANAERTWHYHKRADMVRRTRERFAWLTIQQRIPLLDQIIVIAEPHVRNGRSVPDVGACFPTVKAAIDGIVDAGVLLNDTADHLIGLMFLPPRISGFDGLTIHVIPATTPITEILGVFDDMT